MGGGWHGWLPRLAISVPRSACFARRDGGETQVCAARSGYRNTDLRVDGGDGNHGNGRWSSVMESPCAGAGAGLGCVLSLACGDGQLRRSASYTRSAYRAFPPSGMII